MPKNVINLKNARATRQKHAQNHLRKGATAKFQSRKGNGERLAAWIQILVFFAMFAWFMQTCSI